ncbi:hypothetical protein QCM80_43930 [Bradyrhizobium sp. SSUT112]|uniref:hypothetical protein n=1 Tax=Bradyrhizobium sp. SSUT112 TaxID=3040604 RepID=UPI002448A42E|nr:hypothetical protein [Bradyrhizobium sp. SSUT112]MDH2357453.1 hypothetical protein [Bradyrhizobium sp. SSUT112]
MVQSLKPERDAARILLATALIASAAIDLVTHASAAGPSAEAARKCMHFAYLAFPYKRPGSVRMSPDRQTFFRDCMTKDGKVPEPIAPQPAPASAEVPGPKT